MSGRPPATADQRFDEKWVEAPNGCHIWTAALSRDGYGTFRWPDGRYAHRFSYVRKYGPVPSGLQLDHFYCDNRRCVNPDHVRPVTSRENNLRSNGMAAINLSRTHCPNGHPYKGSYVNPQTGERSCRTCGAQRARLQRWRQRRQKGVYRTTTDTGHGTYAGWRRHKCAGSEPCALCCLAFRAYVVGRRWRKAEGLPTKSKNLIHRLADAA